MCAELKDANREFNHVISLGITFGLLGLLVGIPGFAMLPIAVEGPFALAIGLFFGVFCASFFFGFLFYASGVGEQYARAAGRIAADPAFVLALEQAAASQKVSIVGSEAQSHTHTHKYQRAPTRIPCSPPLGVRLSFAHGGPRQR